MPPAPNAASRRLTVVQLIPALAAGGAERSTLEIAQALVRRGDRAVVVSAGGRLVTALEALGAEHVTLDIGRKSPWTLRHVVTLRALFRRLRPDIVHARSRLPGWLGWWALRTLPPPRPVFVTTVHGLNSPGRYSAILTRGARVICVSETVRAHVRRHYAAVADERLVVVPRGIDPSDFPAGARPDAAWRAAFASAHAALQGRPLLLLPGRGTRLKGHAVAVRLLARLAREHGIDAGLWLLGAVEPGRERYLDELRAAAETLGVAGRVVFSPPRADVRDCYGAADVVLQLSTKPEAFGRTVIEALAVGIPVVGFAHGGVGELLGELFPAGAVPPDDEVALADRVAAVLRAPTAVAVPPRYTLAAMQQATLSVYDALSRERA